MTNENLNRESILATANNLRWDVGENLHDTLMESIYDNATAISKKVLVYPEQKPAFSFDRTLDRILTSRYLGFPIMFLILGVVFWSRIWRRAWREFRPSFSPDPAAPSSPRSALRPLLRLVSPSR